MLEVSELSVRLWHCAVNPAHQSAALSAFLKTARGLGAAVYYECDRDTGGRIRHLGELLELSLIPLAGGGKWWPEVDRLWWWIGTHGPPEAGACPPFFRAGRPPAVTLCLTQWGTRTPLAIPVGHRGYITGQEI